MHHRNPEHPFRSAFSLEPLLKFWKESVAPTCSNMAAMYADFQQRLTGIPELQGTVEDIAVVDRHRDIIAPLMSVVFPVAGWDNEVMGALQGEQVMVISDNPNTHAHCIFTSSSHVPLSELKGSEWLKAVDKGSLLGIPDISTLEHPTHAEQHVIETGARSMLISPLHYQGHILGPLKS